MPPRGAAQAEATAGRLGSLTGARTLRRLGERLAPRGSLRSLFIGFGLIYLMLIPPGIIVIDAISMFATSHSLATHLSFAVPCDVSGFNALPGLSADKSDVLGRGGHCYSIWYPLLPVLAAPFAWLGDALGDLTGQRPENVAQVLALIVPALATAGAATFTAALALKLGASRRGALGAAAAFGFGTEALTYARSFHAETLGAFLVVLAVWGLTETGRRRYLGLAAVGLAVVAKPQLIVVGPALGAVLALRSRNLRELGPPLAASAAGLALYFAYNWLRFADPFMFGGNTQSLELGNYFRPDAIVDALGIYLISPGKGLLWYSPVAVLGAILLWRHRRNPVGMLCMAGFAAVLWVYIGHYAPAEGDSWGERYLVPGLPLLCAALGTARLRSARLAVVLVAIGLVSQVPTTLSFFERTYVEHREQGVNLAHHRWSLEKSPLLTSWPAMVHQLRDAGETDVEEAARSAGPSQPKSVQDTQLLQLVALWWWLLPAVGIPWWIGALFSAAVIAAGGAVAYRAAHPPDRPAGVGETIAALSPPRRPSSIAPREQPP
jgi:hypothetical protein